MDENLKQQIKDALDRDDLEAIRRLVSGDASTQSGGGGTGTNPPKPPIKNP